MNKMRLSVKASHTTICKYKNTDEYLTRCLSHYNFVNKGHSQYPAQGRIRVEFFFFLKDADKSYPFPQVGSKEKCAQSKKPQLILAPNRGRTPNLLLYMQMLYPLSYK